jgi:hypothetical protein
VSPRCVIVVVGDCGDRRAWLLFAVSRLLPAQPDAGAATSVTHSRFAQIVPKCLAFSFAAFFFGEAAKIVSRWTVAGQRGQSLFGIGFAIADHPSLIRGMSAENQR